jgi:arsenical pump membrane protein
MFPIAITAAVVTAVGVGLSFRRHLAVGGSEVGAARVGDRRPDDTKGAAADPEPRVEVGAGLVATAVAVVLVLALHQPALAVLAVGVVATAVELLARRVDLTDVWRILGLPSLTVAFVLTVALGTLARHWNGPAELIDGASGPETAGLAAISTVFVNNLPSAALYSAHAVDHSRMLLLGLNVGPNLAVTGALSALLWFRAAREVDARPSLLEFSRRGIPLALLAMAAAIVVGMLT